jgi:hypothetical protein
MSPLSCVLAVKIYKDFRHLQIPWVVWAVLFLSVPTATAQESAAPNTSRSVLQGSGFAEKGFGGPIFRTGPVPGGWAIFSGGSLDIQVGSSGRLGITSIWSDGDFDGEEVFYAGVRGMWFHDFNPRFRVSLGGLLGGGAWVDSPPGPSSLRRSPLFIVEPEVVVSMAVSPTSRIGVGGSYRLAVGDEDSPGDGRLGYSGPTAVLEIEYGNIGPSRGDQPTSIFGESEDSLFTGLSGFLSLQMIKLGGQFAVMDGGGARVMLDDRWGIGLSGHRAHVVEDSDNRQWRSFYAGLLLQRIFRPHNWVHGSIYSVLGAGKTGFLESPDGQGTLVWHPSFELAGFIEFNVTSFLRLALGGGYRLVIPPENAFGFTVGSTSTPTGMLQLRFGGFGN